MTRPSTSRLLRSAAACALGLALAATCDHAQAQAPSPGDAAAASARADTLFEEGNKAYDGSDFAEAAKKYGEAFALKPTHDIAANLGAAEMKLARFAQAANHLAFSIRHYPPTVDPKKKAGAEKLFGEARVKVGALDVTAPAGAEIVVDGVVVGIAPLADPVFVDPGKHVVEARSGGKSGKSDAAVMASESAKVTVAFGESSEPPPVTPPPGGETPKGDGPPMWPGIALAVAGGVGLGVGLGLFLAGSGAAGDADDLAAGIEESGTTCGDPPTGPRASDCAAGEDKQSTANGLHLGGGIAMGVGGAMAVGGVVYLIWAASADSPPDTAAFQPWISPGLAGGVVQGSF